MDNIGNCPLDIILCKIEKEMYRTGFITLPKAKTFKNLEGNILWKHILAQQEIEKIIT